MRIDGETIETAAILFDGVVYTVPRPGRHHDVMRHMWTQWGDKPGEERFIRGETQGFVTSTGRFVGRSKALRIVKAAGQPQIDHPALNVGGRLYSEDLW